MHLLALHFKAQICKHSRLVRSRGISTKVEEWTEPVVIVGARQGREQKKKPIDLEVHGRASCLTAQHTSGEQGDKVQALETQVRR